MNRESKTRKVLPTRKIKKKEALLLLNPMKLGHIKDPVLIVTITFIIQGIIMMIGRDNADIELT